MKYKVVAIHYVDAPNWIEAENRVEQRLNDPDRIESEPAGKKPRDMVIFGISSKIHDDHNKMFFEDEMDKSYNQKIEELKTRTVIWLEGIVDEIIKSNEQDWE